MASIFHSVRASEHALKSLARAAGVRGKLDFKEWGGILKAINDNVVPIEKWHKGPAKSAALEFYGDALGDARVLKDWARNMWLHVRIDKRADEPQARKALERAEDFVARVATRTTENQRRPITKSQWAKGATSLILSAVGGPTPS